MKRLFLLVALAVFLTASTASLAVAFDGECGGSPQNGKITDISTTDSAPPPDNSNDQMASTTGGTDGRDGQNGRDGRNGRNGRDGRNGRNGRNTTADHKAVEQEVKKWNFATRSYVDAKVATARSSAKKNKDWHGFVDGKSIVIQDGGIANFNYGTTNNYGNGGGTVSTANNPSATSGSLSSTGSSSKSWLWIPILLIILIVLWRSRGAIRRIFSRHAAPPVPPVPPTP